MSRSLASLLGVRRLAPIAGAGLCWSASISAGPQVTGPARALASASGDIESLVRRVSQSVMQIAVRGYRPGGGGALSTSHGVGSGVVMGRRGIHPHERPRRCSRTCGATTAS